MPLVSVFWGPTSTGKSHRAAREAGEDAYWLPPAPGPKSNTWWDGYESHSTVVIDDFDGESIPVSMFFRMTDKYPLQLPIKGGFVLSNIQNIFITSNVDPETWYPAIPPGDKRRGALERRLTSVTHMCVVHHTL